MFQKNFSRIWRTQWQPGILNADAGDLTKEDHASDPEDEEGSDMWRDFS
jgi:hypothetical protein